VRYLVAVTREHEHRLRLRHWLLLLLRTLLILAVILAAAGPSAAARRAGGHIPSALVLVLDNSASAGAVVGGTTQFSDLRAAGQTVLAEATPSDVLWLLAADGVPQRGTPEELKSRIDSLKVSDRRMDLGASLSVAADVLAGDTHPGGIVLISDLQATAVTPTSAAAPLVVVRPESQAAPNVGVVDMRTSPQPWTPDGGSVTVSLAGDSGRSVPVSVSVGDRPAGSALSQVGSSLRIAVGSAPVGWLTLHAFIDADEFRADDERFTALRVAPIAGVSWGVGDRYVNAAAEVLQANGRIRRGQEVTVGSLGPEASVVPPPADPAELGALNRALAQRGSGWSFDVLIPSPGITDSGPLVGRERIDRRYRLRATRTPGASGGGVLATVGGEPWIVRTGKLVILGSRLDPEWTRLPLSAGFMPFLDALINRVARGQVAVLDRAPGDPVLLPDLVTEVRSGPQHWTVEGGAAFRPPAKGVYFLVAGTDTVGALSVNLDPRESALARASDDAIHQLWPSARVIGPRQAGTAAFAQVGRADLQGPLLWLAFGLALAEVALASGWKRRE
jgi:hypothetical protein